MEIFYNALESQTALEDIQAQKSQSSTSHRPKTPDAIQAPESDLTSPESAQCATPIWSAPSSPIPYDSPATITSTLPDDNGCASDKSDLSFEWKTIKSSGHPVTSQFLTLRETIFIDVDDCVQCEFKKLPCDRRLPCCSRCARNGHGDSCLPQRCGILKEPAEWHTTSRVRFLVVLEGDMVDGKWKRKTELMGEVRVVSSTQHGRQTYATSV